MIFLIEETHSNYFGTDGKVFLCIRTSIKINKNLVFLSFLVEIMVFANCN